MDASLLDSASPAHRTGPRVTFGGTNGGDAADLKAIRAMEPMMPVTPTTPWGREEGSEPQNGGGRVQNAAEHAAEEDVAPPAAYWFETQQRAELSGAYMRVVGLQYHGKPVWESSRGDVLYFNGKQWALAHDREDAASGRDTGVLSEGSCRLPHLAESWEVSGCCDPTAAAHPDANTNSTVEDLMQHLCHEYYRWRGYRHVLYYSIFLFLLVFDFVYSNSVEVVAWDSKSVEQILDAQGLSAVVSEGDMWVWMQGSVGRLWELSPAQLAPELRKKQIRLSGGVAVQQYRSGEVPCSSNDNWVIPLGLPPGTEGELLDEALRTPRTRCASRFGATDLSRLPFGTNLRFNYSEQGSDPRYMEGFTRKNLLLETDVYTYPSDTADSFMVPLPANGSAASALQQLSELQSNQFVDSFTRLITFDVILLTPDPDVPVLIGFQGIFEYLGGGYVIGQYKISSSSFASERGEGWRLFYSWFWSVTCLILAVSLLQTLLVKVKLRAAGKNRRLSLFGVWDVYEALHLYVFLSLLVGFWTRGLDFSPCGDDMFVCFTWFDTLRFDADRREANAWLLMVSLLRALKYFRYNDNLNALSETVRVAVTDLTGIVFTFLLIHFAFAMGGNVLYGAEILDFRTTLESASHLLRILVSASIDDWDSMYRIHRWSSALFFGLYFVIVWLLMLNMVLAIVAASFSIVHERMHRAVRIEWSVYTALQSFASGWSTYTRQREKYIAGMKLRGRASPPFVLMEVFVGGFLIECADPPTQQLASLLSLLRYHADQEKERLMLHSPGSRAESFPDSSIDIASLRFRELCALARPAMTDAEEIYCLFAASQHAQQGASSGRAAGDGGAAATAVLDRLGSIEDALRRQDAVLQTILRQLEVLGQGGGAGGGGGVSSPRGRASMPADAFASLEKKRSDDALGKPQGSKLFSLASTMNPLLSAVTAVRAKRIEKEKKEKEREKERSNSENTAEQDPDSFSSLLL